MNTNQETNNESNQCTTEEANQTNGDTGNEITTSPATVSSNQKESEAAKNINVISEQYASSERVIIEYMEQGSPKWHEGRRGCITMSNAKAMLTGGKGLTRRSYLISVASEILSGVSSDTYKSWHMERGNILEPYARDAYLLETGHEVKEVGLGYLNALKRISASPDAIGIDRGLEIKCQMPKNHLATIINGTIPKDFTDQMQGGMWVFEKERWDYVSFCPEFKPQPLFIMSLYRDEEVIKRLEGSCLKGVEEIDQFVKTATREVSKETLAICDDALDMIETFKNVDPEIF